MRALLILTLSAVGCFGQAFTFSDPAFVAQQYVAASGGDSWIPTNANMVAWWKADTQTTDGATNGVLTWPDSYNSYTLSWNGSSPFLTNSVLNGHSIVQFGTRTTDRLFHASISNQQPIEIWCVLRFRAPAKTYFGGYDGSVQTRASYSTTYGPMLFAGSYTSTQAPDAVAGLTNFQWFCMTAIFDSTRSRITTNDVLLKSGDAGTGQMYKFYLGKDPLNNNATDVSFAEILYYAGATNDAAMRSNIWNTYLKPKFGL